MLLEREVLMITIANPEKYVAGLYERLSNENIEVGNGEVIVSNKDERESGSISTQKLFLRNFCKENNIRVYDDYTDDGFSGATFDRPDFNRMIKDIENKKINLIIVKDLSRFGRLSSKISYYLEEFNIVQDMIKSRTSTRVKSYDWLLKGLVCCKECGKKLSLVPQKHPNKTTFYFRCNTYASNTQLGLCTPHSNNLEKVTDFVIEQIKSRCKEFLDEEKYSNLANTSKDKIIKNKYNVKNEILILEKKIKDINKKIDKLFEDKYSGLFEEEDFTRIYARQIETRKDTEERIKQLKAMEEKEESSVDINKLVKDFVNMKEITIYYKFNILNMRKLENRLENVS